MTERPILFSGPMVRAILDGTKTQTRRVIKVPRGRGLSWVSDDAGRQSDWLFTADGEDIDEAPRALCLPGDRLWVRETWGLCSPFDATCWFRGSLGGRTLDEMTLSWRVEYREDWRIDDGSPHWRPSIFMPRWASRITLEVTDVRVERLQSISTLEAMAEGAEPRPTAAGNLSYTTGFHRLWDSINAGRGFGWDVNPWVWVVQFRRIDVPGGGE